MIKDNTRRWEKAKVLVFHEDLRAAFNRLERKVEAAIGQKQGHHEKADPGRGAGNDSHMEIDSRVASEPPGPRARMDIADGSDKCPTFESGVAPPADGHRWFKTSRRVGGGTSHSEHTANRHKSFSAMMSSFGIDNRKTRIDIRDLSGVVIARGFEKFAHSDHGPVLKVRVDDIVWKNSRISRQPTRDAYFALYRSRSKSNNKIYYQLRTVADRKFPPRFPNDQFNKSARGGREGGYADYEPGWCYLDCRYLKIRGKRLSFRRREQGNSGVLSQAEMMKMKLPSKVVHQNNPNNPAQIKHNNPAEPNVPDPNNGPAQGGLNSGYAGWQQYAVPGYYNGGLAPPPGFGPYGPMVGPYGNWAYPVFNTPNPAAQDFHRGQSEPIGGHYVDPSRRQNGAEVQNAPPIHPSRQQGIKN